MGADIIAPWVLEGYIGGDMAQNQEGSERRRPAAQIGGGLVAVSP